MTNLNSWIPATDLIDPTSGGWGWIWWTIGATQIAFWSALNTIDWDIRLTRDDVNWVLNAWTAGIDFLNFDTTNHTFDLYTTNAGQGWLLSVGSGNATILRYISSSDWGWLIQTAAQGMYGFIDSWLPSVWMITTNDEISHFVWASTFYEIDWNTRTTRIGDVSSTGLDTLITLNDTTGIITLSASWYSPSSADIAITVKQTILNAAISTLNSVPVTLSIPAPGVGKMLQPMFVVGRYTGTTAFTVNTSLELYFDTLTNTYMSGGNIINQTSDTTSPFAVIGSQNRCMIENKWLKLRIATWDPVVAGDGDLIIYTTYKIVTL